MVERTQAGLLRTMRNDITSLKRRIARGAFALPDRLGPVGQEVIDWNNATASGFYWGNNATNAPTSGIVFGYVETDGTRVVQTMHDPSALLTSTRRRVYSGGVWGAWKRIGVADLPAPQNIPMLTTITITATATGVIVPGTSTLSFTVDQACLVDIDYGAWIISGAGETRFTATCSGATAVGWPPLNWGNVPIMVAANGTTTMQFHASYKAILQPGTTNIRLEAYKTGASTNNTNYPMLQVTPLRWM